MYKRQLLLAAFFCAQLALTSFTRGQPATALVFAITASLSSLLAAWTVQRLTPREGGVGLVAALLAGAVVGAGLSALLGGGWLWPVSYTHLDVYKRQACASCSRWCR